MNILKSLQSMFDGDQMPAPSASGKGGIGAGLGNLLNSGAMGGIAQTILGDKKGGISLLKAALMAGAGSMLWKRLTTQMAEQSTAKANVQGTPPRYVRQPAESASPAPDAQASRMIRAIVFAAKADGHIDAREKAAISAQIRNLHVGAAGEEMVQQAMNEALDPRLIADGVTDPEEALQLYALSAAVVDPDHFMEKSYLDALADALEIIPDIKRQVDTQLEAHRATTSKQSMV